jgi:diadenosine tetraphosphatase ApaH/serine/threonine PP2A family protein phosphatase
MIFAAIADIHGNALALEAVLADIRGLGIARVVNLGDVVSGPLAPRRTVEVLAGLDLPTIRGNHDRWVAENDPETMGPSDRIARDQLDAGHLDWLGGLPQTLIYEDEAFLCHGTPASDTTYWMEAVAGDGTVHLASIEAIEAAADGIDQPLILCAHTHIPRSVRLRDGRLVVNPGSVGCPGYVDVVPVRHAVEAGTPLASYAVLEKTGRGWQPSFRQVAYDHMAMSRLAADNGRPEWAGALATGWIR